MPDPTTAVDALDEALSAMAPAETPAATPAEETPAPDETPEPQAPADEVVETPEEGEEAAEVDAEDGGEKPEASGQPRDDKGKFAKKAADDAAAKKAGEETPAAKKPGEEAAGKKPDHVNDPIPKELNERTRERITSLATTVKEQAPIVAAYHEVMAAIQESGMSAQEYNTALTYGKLIRSTNIDDLRQAHSFLQSEIAALGARIGETPSGVDALEGHQDLIDLVKANPSVKPIAEEVAKNRNREKAASSFKNEVTAEQQAEADFQAQQAEAKGQLTQLGNQLAQSLGADEYNRRYAIVVPQMKEAFKHIHPSRWVSTMRAAFANVPAAPVAAVAPVAPAPAQRQPMRANKAPAGGAASAPKSAVEAMDAALAQFK